MTAEIEQLLSALELELDFLLKALVFRGRSVKFVIRLLMCKHSDECKGFNCLRTGRTGFLLGVTSHHIQSYISENLNLELNGK